MNEEEILFKELYRMLECGIYSPDVPLMQTRVGHFACLTNIKTGEKLEFYIPPNKLVEFLEKVHEQIEKQT